jgi:hypothetical protein
VAQIGTLNEGTLHRQLKALIAEPGDRFEVALGGYVIDVVRGERLIEIQTGPLGPLGAKLDALLDAHPVTIVHPIAVRTWLHVEGRPPRRSPIRRGVHHVFHELVSIPTLLDHPNLRLELVLIEEDVHRRRDPSLRRRLGGWRTLDRAIRSVVERAVLTSARDLARLLPPGLPEPFTTRDLARGAGIPRELAQRMAYCLRALGRIEEAGRSRAGVRYRLVSGRPRRDPG